MLLGRPRTSIPGVVQLQLWGLLALTVLRPYWWEKTGALSVPLGAVLPIWTFLLLLVWGAIELEHMRGADQVRTSERARRLARRAPTS